MVLVGSGSVSNYTDPDSGSSQFFIRIRIQGNYVDSTDPPHCLRHYANLDFKIQKFTISISHLVRAKKGQFLLQKAVFILDLNLRLNFWQARLWSETGFIKVKDCTFYWYRYRKVTFWHTKKSRLVHLQYLGSGPKENEQQTHNSRIHCQFYKQN